MAKVKPNFGEAKVQTECNTKKSLILFCMAKVKPNFGEAKVQTECNTKEKLDFIL